MGRMFVLLAVFVLAACGGPISIGDFHDGGGVGGGSGGGGSGMGGGTGGGVANTPVTLGGYTLQPRSAIMAASLPNAPVSSGGGRTLLAFVSDIENPCSGYRCRVSATGVGEGTHLIFQIFGTSLKTYSIGNAVGNASVTFLRAGPLGTSVFSDDTVSGTVTLLSFSENGKAAGRYDVTMKSGTVIRGTFEATYCKGLALDVPMGGVACEETGSAASCSNSCTCEGKTVSVSCTSTGTNMWSCDCSSPSGAHSTCTMSGPTAVPAYETACWSYGTCCPMKF